MIESLHLEKTWEHTETRARHGSVGTGISCSSSLAVGIQKARRPPSTSVSAAKTRMLSSMAKKFLGFLGGTKLGSLFVESTGAVLEIIERTSQCIPQQSVMPRNQKPEKKKEWKTTDRYILTPACTTQGVFSGSRQPSTIRPSRTPYGGSETMPSSNRLPLPAPAAAAAASSPSRRRASGTRRTGELVRSAANMPPRPPTSPYCSKLPLTVFFLSDGSPRMARPSMSLPQHPAPKWAAASGKPPVPTKGS